PALYEDLDIVVHASTRPEPFGRTIIEAMSFGKAVVAADQGGVIEIIEPEVNGLLFQSGNSLSLAAAISRLIADETLRSALGDRARKDVTARFSLQQYGNSIQEVYRLMENYVS